MILPGRSLCLLTIIATAHGMAVGRNESDRNRNHNPAHLNDEEESSIEELDDIKPLSGASESIWGQMFSPGNLSHIALLPKTVYDFQTGKYLDYFYLKHFYKGNL